MSTDSNEAQNQSCSAKPPSINLADEKVRLECRRLEVEIENLRKPPYCTIAFYSSLFPVMLAAFGLLWSWSSGWFDVQRTRVANEKAIVEAQTERLKAERFTLDREAAEQRTHVATVEKEIRNLQEERSILTNQIVRLERDRNEMRSARDYFENEARRLAGSETNALRMLSELHSLQAEREGLSIELQGLQLTNRMLWASVSNQTKLLSRAQKVMLNGVGIAVSDKAIYSRFKDHIGEVWSLNADLTSYLPEWQTDEDDGLPPGVHRDRRWITKTYEDYMKEADARATNKQSIGLKALHNGL